MYKKFGKVDNIFL